MSRKFGLSRLHLSTRNWTSSSLTSIPTNSFRKSCLIQKLGEFERLERENRIKTLGYKGKVTRDLSYIKSVAVVPLSHHWDILDAQGDSCKEKQYSVAMIASARPIPDCGRRTPKPRERVSPNFVPQAVASSRYSISRRQTENSSMSRLNPIELLPPCATELRTPYIEFTPSRTSSLPSIEARNLRHHPASKRSRSCEIASQS